MKRGRTFLFLAGVVAAWPLGAAEMLPPAASATYSGGTCQLRVNSVSQVSSSQNRKGFAVAMELQLEFPPAPGTAQLPTDLYLDNDATPLIAASVVAGKNLGKTPHLWAVDGKSGRVTISDLEIGEARLRLQAVEFELVLTKVLEWETRNFSAQPGRSDFFQCGPFELRTFGEPQRFRVDAWAYPQFRKEHDAYRLKTPVTFLTPIYAVQEVKVIDAANHSPTSTGSTIPESGAVSSTYTGWRALEATDAAASTASDDITYPVALAMKLPKRFEKERVRFRFNVIPLPEPSAKAR